MRFRLNHLLLLAVLGCSPARSSPAPDQGRDPYRVRAEELDSSNRTNLYDALFELRPRWFTRAARANTGDPFVYMDDQVLGTTGVLRRFIPSQVAEVRYLSPTEAQVMFGQRNRGRAAIVIVAAQD